MRHMRLRLAGALMAVAGMAAAGPAAAQACGGDFNQWLEGLKREAMAVGVSAGVIQVAAPALRFDPGVVRRDRGQAVFAQSFLEFAGRMVNAYRLEHGARNLQRHAATFERIERQFGVPGPVIASFWGLETDYGANLGDFPTLTALTSLAFDCRRPELFRPQLIAALRIVERGDLSPGEMRGAWAGELGQTQFLPLDYLENGVDYDGDGRVDLLRSVPDVLASTANVLAKAGWRQGEPWLQEVRVPASLPWEQADLAIRHPRSQWVAWGVRAADGSALPSDGLSAGLILPMGRNGPAFLAYPNFDIYLEWNQSLVYATTAAFFATRLAGAPRVSGGQNVPVLSLDQVKQLQQLLAQHGYDVGGIDGVIGARTRAAIKEVQLRFGLPADSWPTPELLARLRG
jgi:lytic murein transglycosylase